jgi:hypothetical protein
MCCDLERIGKEKMVACFNILCWYVFEMAEENQSGAFRNSTQFSLNTSHTYDDVSNFFRFISCLNNRVSLWACILLFIAICG